MNRTLGPNKAKMPLLPLGALLLFSFLAFTLPPVQAQALFDLNWMFDYTPLVSGAPNSLHVRIHNTARTPIRMLSVSIGFSWMEAGTYISSRSSDTPQDLAPEQEVRYAIPFEIPANVTTGRYSMNTLLQYQVFQGTQWAGPQAITYALDVVVLGRSSSSSMTTDPYDGRLYSAFALFTLIGWYLPRKLRPKTKA